MKIKRRVFLLDDDEVSSQILKKQLEDAGYECLWCATSLQLFELLAKIESAGMFLLDFSLVGDDLSGLEVCKRLRPLYNNPVVMLTGNRNTETVVACMAAGADLYIEKPYSIQKLIAKIGAIERLYDKYHSPSSQRVPVAKIKSSTVIFSASERQLESAYGQIVRLTEKEAAFYEIIYSRDMKYVSRDEAYLALYGRAMNPMNRTIDNLACRVRSKLKSLDCSIELQVMRGVGYRLLSTRKI